MASLSGYYNTDDKPASFDALPAGDYIAAIVDSKMKTTKAGTGEYLSLTWEIMEGEYKGRKLFENLNLQNPNPKAQEIARGSFAAIRKATNVLNPQDSVDLHNIPVAIKVGGKKDEAGEIQNVIKAYKPKSELAASNAPASGSIPPYKRQVG